VKIHQNEGDVHKYEEKIQVKSVGSAIISHKEYYIQFRPYVKEILRALRSFFELIIYTHLNKSEAEAIVNLLEKDENFFTYIIPVNYCQFIQSENVYLKDLEIFMGNRTVKDFIMIGSQPFDFFPNQQNGIPIRPFYGEEDD